MTTINKDCPGCTDLTNRLVTADSMAIALELMLKQALDAIDRANSLNSLECPGKWYSPVIDQDTVDWWAKNKDTTFQARATGQIHPTLGSLYRVYADSLTHLYSTYFTNCMQDTDDYQ